MSTPLVNGNGRAALGNTALRLEVEDFLYYEAALLDDWDLDEWLALFTDDAKYIVPTTDLPEGDPTKDLVFIDDSIVQLQGRVTRLKSRHAHREYPSSRTRRLITNVRVLKAEGDVVEAEANFAVYRARSNEIGAYVGRYEYTLVRDAHGGFRIRHRRATLDNEILHDHGAVSIIL